LKRILPLCVLVLLATGGYPGPSPVGAQGVAGEAGEPGRGLLFQGDEPEGSVLAHLVPFLAQPPLLCGGAAAAMVERYWGRFGVYAEDYQDLVRPQEGGIRFSDLAEELKARGWRVTVVRESPERTSQLVAEGVPVIALLEPDPNLRHYVVVVEWTDESVGYHDPARGPDIRQPTPDFLDDWRATGFRGIVIVPDTSGGSRRTLRGPEEPRVAPPGVGGSTDARESAGSPGENVSAAAPARPRGPLRLAREAFEDGRYGQASSLAEGVAHETPSNRSAWRILAASRYLDGRPLDALSAWNRIGMPRVDLIRVMGAHHTPEPLILRRLGTRNREILTPEALRLASRRAASLPAVERARTDYSPNADGSVEVRVHLLERRAAWESWTGATGALLEGLTRGDLTLEVPGLLGEGELFQVGGRWRSPRREMGILFAAAPSFAPGVVTVQGAWGREVFAGPEGMVEPSARGPREREEWTRVSLGLRDWIRPDLEAGLRILTGRWKARGRFVGLGASSFVLREGATLGIRLRAEGWKGMDGHNSFAVLDGEARWRTSRLPGTSLSAESRAGLALTSVGAPRSMQPGAGLGIIRPYLLRAHPLTQDGAVREERLARGIGYAGATLLGPAWRTGPIRFVAGPFADLAAPWGDQTAQGWDLDVGLTARVSVLATGGWLQFSVARGLRDGAHAVSLSWTESWWPE